MGVSTKGIVATSNKDVMLAAGLAVNALKTLFRAEKQGRLGVPWPVDRKVAKVQYREPVARLLPDLGMVSVDFTFRLEPRTLNLFFTCDCDHQEFGPQSLLASMGAQGLSYVFIPLVLHAWRLLGPTYYDANDSDEEPARPVHADEPPTVLQALAHGYLRSSDLNQWLDQFDAGTLDPARHFEALFGMPEGDTRVLAARPSSAAIDAHWRELDVLADDHVAGRLPSPIALLAP